MVIYTALNPTHREIRLVRFAREPPEHSRPGIPALELRKVSLDDHLSYSALSYVWGSAADTVKVEINGLPFHVTHNLHGALEQLEKNGVNSWLWIDAICIEQCNLEEKTHQVNMMREIFSSAEIVHAWLGSGTEETDQVMDFIAKFGSQLQTCEALYTVFNRRKRAEAQTFVRSRFHSEVDLTLGNGPESELGRAILNLYTEYHERGRILIPGVSDILHRSYWGRIWTIQEVVLAPEVTVMIGTKSVSLDAFDATFTAMFTDSSFTVTQLPLTLYRIKSLEIRRARIQENLTRPLNLILWETGRAPNRPHYAASDPRDIVIGLLGVLSEDEKRELGVDYTQSFNEIFSRATRVMFRDLKPRRYFGLDSVKPGEPGGPLPTWVPDFREIGQHGVHPYPINHTGKFRATRTRVQPRRSCDDLFDVRALRRWGYVVDEVTEVFEPPEWSDKGRHGVVRPKEAVEWARSVVNFIGLGPESGPGEDYVWRTALCGYEFLQPCWNIYRRAATKEVPIVLRRIMRMEPVDTMGLSVEGARFIRSKGVGGGGDLGNTEEPLTGEEINNLVPSIRMMVARRTKPRTLFKTAKGMLGLGHTGIKPGDVVTLILGVSSPIILRQRDKGGFYFRGDAYVDGIMQGEFLDTGPCEVDFAIY